MRKARTFFYVCAGFLCLVLAYHCGARSAVAQSIGSGLVGSTGCNVGSAEPTMALIVDRTVYRATLSGTYGFQLQSPLPPIPGSAPIVSYDAGCSGFAILADGEVWAGGGPTWRYVGNLMGGPTPVSRESFGQVKVRYR